MSKTRVKESDLQQLVHVLNIRTHSPLETFRKDVDGLLNYNAGNFHLEMAYGCVKLVRAIAPGGTKDISGFCTKRELKIFIEAYILGLEANNEANARLIAAAPEMYDALVRIIDAFGINPFMKARREMSAEELNDLIKLAVEAVRKAEGK